MRQRDIKRWKSHRKETLRKRGEKLMLRKTGSEFLDGFQLTREAVMAHADARKGFRVCGMHRREQNTPELCIQAGLDYRINPQAVYGGWRREPYKVSGRF